MSVVSRKIAPATGTGRRLDAAEVAAGVLDSTAYVGRNMAHFAHASDCLSDEVSTEADRSLARARCRSEYLNAGYIANAVRSFTHHVLGPAGPRLKLVKKTKCPHCPEITPDEIAHVEEEWTRWAEATENDDKLEHCIGALMYDGEAYLKAIYDPYIDGTNLNFEEIEAKRITHPFVGSADPDEIEGIVYDGVQPVLYYVQRRVKNINLNYQFIFDQVPAEQMLVIRSTPLIGQHRGLPIMQTVLQQQADYRKWVTYTLGAAEQAARGGNGFLKALNLPPDAVQGGRLMTQYAALEPGMFKVLPPGYEPASQKPEFPMSNFDSFGQAINRETGAGIGVPLGIMSADTSRYTYSSYKGEKQNYWVFIARQQYKLGVRILSPQFNLFFRCRASFDPIFAGILDRYGGDVKAIPRGWCFAKPPSLDPQKDAASYSALLGIGVMSRHQICSDMGYDYDDVCDDLEDECGVMPTDVDPNSIAAMGDTPQLSDTGQLAASGSAASPPTETPTAPPPQTPTIEELPSLLSAQEASERLGVSASQISGWRNAGLKSYKLGSRVKYSMSQLMEFLEAGRSDKQDENTEQDVPDKEKSNA